jgi:predicted kinase
MSTPNNPKLIFFCGKMAAGKSTLARELAARENAIILEQDHWLSTLFRGEIDTIPDYVRLSSRLTDALTPLICALLAKGISVTLDFPANTVRQRAWFRELINRTHADHELHFLDVPDDICKRQLRERSASLPDGARWTTEAEFDAITAYFRTPTEDEGFHVIRHERR